MVRGQAKETLVALSNGWKSTATLMVGGLIGVVLAPAIAPALGRVARPAAKAGIKAGLVLFERGRLVAAELLETMEDITAEVQAEFDEERGIHRTERAAVQTSPGPDVVH
jgi:Protein of unknown function (DUF5132)